MKDYELFARSVLLFTEAVSVKCCNEARLACGHAPAYPEGVISNQIAEIESELQRREHNKMEETWTKGKEEYVGALPKREGDEFKVVQNTPE